MSLVWLIVIGLIAYVGLQYLRTFQDMVSELRDMRRTCIASGASGASGAGGASGASNAGIATSQKEPIALPMGDMKDRLVSVLSYLKTSA